MPIKSKEPKKSFFLQTWNLMNPENPVSEKLSTAAIMGSEINLNDALIECGELEVKAMDLNEVIKQYDDQLFLKLAKYKELMDTAVAKQEWKFGLNCVLDKEKENRDDKTMDRGELSGNHPNVVLDNAYLNVGPNHNDMASCRSEYKFYEQSIPKRVVPTNGGPIDNVDVEEVKPSIRKVYSKKSCTRTDSSIQTDKEQENDDQEDEEDLARYYNSIKSFHRFTSTFPAHSTSEFPSLTPSVHNNAMGKRLEALNSVSIPEQQTLKWNEYIDTQSVVEYTSETVNSVYENAKHFIYNYVIMPEETLYTEEELREGEGGIIITLMRLIGIPKLLRHDIYNETAHSIDAIKDISVETFSLIGNVIDWVSDGPKGGKSEIINRIRRIASVTTDFDPNSVDWVEFERDFCILSNDMTTIVKMGYDAGKDVARRCSETIIDKIRYKKRGATGEMTPNASDGGVLNGQLTTNGPSTSRASASLPIIIEESSSENDGPVPTDLTKETIDPESMSPPSTSAPLKVEPQIGGNSLSTNQIGGHPSDALLEARAPMAENPVSKIFNTVCKALTTMSFSTTSTKSTGEIYGTALSVSKSRNEPMINEIQIENKDELAMEVDRLKAEVANLARLADSYFIQSEDSLIEIPEPKATCPPPPMPIRASSSQLGVKRAKTAVSFHTDDISSVRTVESESIDELSIEAELSDNSNFGEDSQPSSVQLETLSTTSSQGTSSTSSDDVVFDFNRNGKKPKSNISQPEISNKVKSASKIPKYINQHPSKH